MAPVWYTGVMSIWHPVPRFPFVEVTRDCRVRSVERTIIAKNRWGTTGKRRFLSREYKQYIGGNGYPRVAVHHPEKGMRHPIYVHRLMALAFVDGYKDGHHVNHINGIKTDNRAENLEWVPNWKNVKHAWQTELVNLNGENSPLAKLTWRKVEAIRRALALGVNAYTLSIICDVSHGTIDKIAMGESWIVAMDKTSGGHS